MEGGVPGGARELRILVFADLHLDRAYPWATREVGAAQRAAQEITFEAICAIASAEADLLVSAGDLYDFDRHHPDTGELLRGGFERLAPMPVLLLPGETDPADRVSLYEQVRWSPNVHVIREAELVEPVLGLTVWAAPFGTEADMPAANPGEIRLALLRWPAPGLVAELEGRTDVSHIVVAGGHSPAQAARTVAPGAAHPVEPEDPAGGIVLLTVAPDGTVHASLRELGSRPPQLPQHRFATSDLEGMDLAVVGEEQTVRGEFVRNLLAPDEDPVHLRRLALLAGMRALEGRPPRR